MKSVIGRGGFGKVLLIESKTNKGEVYAMKAMDKQQLLNEDQIEMVRREKQILLEANHPFLVSMKYVFQTENKILFVMPFARGGELFSYLRRV